MTPEQWQDVKELLVSALEREPGQRKAYLDEVCRVPLLRQEVESLIAALVGSGVGRVVRSC